MILDAQAVLSDAQAITATANSTNVYDLGVARDTAPGFELDLTVLVNQAFTASGAGTLTVALVAADDTGLSTNATTLWTTAAIGKATLTAGYRLAVAVPRNPAFAKGQRYLGLIYTVATGPMTAGKVTAALNLKAQDDSGVFYPRAPFVAA
jgi:hypothetical protein